MASREVGVEARHMYGTEEGAEGEIYEEAEVLQ